MEAVTIAGRPYLSAIEATGMAEKSASTIIRLAKLGAFRAKTLHGLFVDLEDFQRWQAGQAAKKAKSSN